ncbi:hypothetical protein NP233_g12395 [Leucocoprinus birnbaumii]|uniref:Uncharacterized protein n=1 Tax=Leucocoprinus birnbaumii TaxID=56174 RepID=A0AAD5VGE4_9AGAR|nr:hypothetical protein NP233_g12395 [Leucocoprinus birnbaumii]
MTWSKAEKLLVKATDHLSKENKLCYAKPFLPSAWGYSNTFASHREALRHIEEGQDWFAMWLGVLYWLVRRTPEGEGCVEGLKPETWVIMLIRYTLQQREVNLLCLNLLLQRGWRVDHVGVFLHNPLHAIGQPSAEWFVHQGISVWYRWGEAEYSMPLDISGRLVALSYELIRKAHSQLEEDQINTTVAPPVSFSQYDYNFSDEPTSYSYDAVFELSNVPTSSTSPILTTSMSDSLVTAGVPPDPIDPDTAAVEKRALEDAEKCRQAHETWEEWKLKLDH